MREIQASEAERRLPTLLDDVERGETLIITRHGKAIARLVPAQRGRREDFDSAIEAIKSIRTRTGKVTVEELLSARDEGRRF